MEIWDWRQPGIHTFINPQIYTYIGFINAVDYLNSRTENVNVNGDLGYFTDMLLYFFLTFCTQTLIKKNSFSTALFLSLVFLSCKCLSVLNLQPQWTRITKFCQFTRMMSLKLLLALALVAVVTGSEEFEVGARRRREVCAEHSNGCSIPGDLPFFYKNTFTPACDRHDMCYNCVSTLDR